MRVVRVVLVLVAAAIVVACGDDGGEGAVPVERAEAETYVAVVSWFADRAPPVEEGESLPVFLEGLDDGMIPLDVQVRVLDVLDGDLSMRFIDSLDEAVDDGIDGAPVRDGGLLLRLGPVVLREQHREVDVEHYEDAERVKRYRIEVRSRSGTWRVVGEPAEIPLPDPPPDEPA